MPSIRLTLVSKMIILLASSLMHASSIAANNTEAFWVLGSFSKADNAHAERTRLSDTLGVDVEIRFDESLAVFRLITSAEKLDREGLQGTPAWKIQLVATTDENPEVKTQEMFPNPGAITEIEAESQKPPSRTDNQTIQVGVPGQSILDHPNRPGNTESPEPSLPAVTAEPTPLYPALEPEESLSEYCLRLPDAALCQHPRIERALEADRKLMNHRQDMQTICRKITDSGRRETCEQLHFTQ